MSRVIFSTLHWSVYFKRRPPASVYAVRNEQGFLTTVSFHVMLSVFVAATLFPHAYVNETCKRTGCGRSWPPDADSLRNYITSLNNPTPVPVPDRDRRIRRNQYLLTVRSSTSAMAARLCQRPWTHWGTAFIFWATAMNIRQLWHYYLCFCFIIMTLVFKRISWLDSNIILVCFNWLLWLHWF